MSAENVLAGLLGDSSLNTMFSDRRALVRLPQDTDQKKPCLVYAVITDLPTPNVNYADGKARARARCRITVTALTPTEVIDGLDAVRGLVDFKHGGDVLIMRKVASGPMQRDDSLGVWWRPDDYELAYYE